MCVEHANFGVVQLTAFLLSFLLSCLLSSDHTVSISAVADPPLLTVPPSPVIAEEFTSVLIPNISALVADTDPSNGPESITGVVIWNVPFGVIFTSSTPGLGNTGTGGWSMLTDALDDLWIKAPEHFAGTMTLNLTAQVEEKSNKDKASAWQTFEVYIKPKAAPVFILAKDKSLGSSGSVDTQLNVRMQDTRGPVPGEPANPGELLEEQLHLTFSDVPVGAYFLPRQGGRLIHMNATVWTFQGTQDQANALTMYTGPDPALVASKDIVIEGYTIDGDDELDPPVVDGFRLFFTEPTSSGIEVVGSASSDNNITGGDGNDVLRGYGGDDILSGGPGIDILQGGPGADELSGGIGTDIFFWEESDLDTTLDVIKDWNNAPVSSGGDLLDFSQLIVGFDPQGFDPLKSDIEDFIQLTETGSDTLVWVDKNGEGTFSTPLVKLEGLTEADLADMLANGNILL